MIPGANFQPGSLEQEQQRKQQATGSGEGVQEAIKVLSLRLPKVVGAQAIAPQALLQSPGSGGNRNVDSIVQSVLSRIFPQGDTSGAPMLPVEQPQENHGYGNGPSFSGPIQTPQRQGASDPNGSQGASDFWGTYPRPPQVISGPPPEATFTNPPPRYPNQPTPDGGGGMGFGNMIEPLPDLRRNFDWLPGAGGSEPPPMI